MYFDLGLLLPGILLAVVVGAALHVKVGAQIKTTAIVCLLIIGIFGGVSLYSGYDQHNELTMGDYAHEQCDFNGGALIGMCSKTPSVCKVRQGFDGDFYYCKEHLFYAEYLIGKASYGKENSSGDSTSHTCYVCGEEGNMKYGSFYYCPTHWAYVKTVVEAD